MNRRLTLPQLATMLYRRKGAYARLFKEKDHIGPDASIILADLRRFCRADGTSTFSENPQKMALLEGRREVFERIMAYINASDDDIKRLQEQVPTE